MTTTINNTNLLPCEQLDPSQFQDFCRDLLQQYRNIDFSVRGSRGQKQNGYDILATDGSGVYAECKHWKKVIPSKFEQIVTKFKKDSNNSMVKEFIICFSTPHVIKTQIIDLIKNHDHNTFKLTKYDGNEISSMMKEKHLYGLVSRYFSPEVFREFFGEKIYNIFFADTVFRHYPEVLQVKIKSDHIGTIICEDLIRQKKVLRDESIITSIRHLLSSEYSRICLVSAPEGRGKTILSMIVAYEKYTNESCDVFFLDFRNFAGTFEHISDQFHQWADSPGRFSQQYLIVLENVHILGEQQYTLCEILKSYQKVRNLSFLLTTREEKNKYYQAFTEAFIFLEYSEDHIINGVIKIWESLKYKNDTDQSGHEDYKNFLATKINADVNKQNRRSPNLRLIAKYLNIWINSGSEVKLSDVSEQKFFLEFLNEYSIQPYSPEAIQFQCLCAVNQFDLPFYFNKSDQSIFSFLQLASRNGLIEGRKISMYHPTDARLLFNSICAVYKDEPLKETTNKIIAYIENLILIKSSGHEALCNELEHHFSMLMTGIHSDNTHHQLYNNLCFYDRNREFINKIVRQLNYGFIALVLAHNKTAPDSVKGDIIKDFFDKTLDDKALRGLNAYVLSMINAMLKKHYQYDQLVKILFKEYSVFKTWVENTAFYSGKYWSELKEDIRRLGSEHEKKFEEIIKRRSEKPHPLLKKFYFEEENSPCYVKITRKWWCRYNDDVSTSQKNEDGILSDKNNEDPTQEKRPNISDLFMKDFYFSKISWADIGRLLNRIKKDMEKPVYSSKNAHQVLMHKICDKALVYPGSIAAIETLDETKGFVENVEAIEQGYIEKLINIYPLLRERIITLLPGFPIS